VYYSKRMQSAKLIHVRGNISGFYLKTRCV